MLESDTSVMGCLFMMWLDVFFLATYPPSNVGIATRGLHLLKRGGDTGGGEIQTNL